MKLKRILKYALVFILGFLVGFCVTYELAKDLARKTYGDNLWGTTAPAHEDVYSPKDAPKDTINVPARQIYDENLGKYIKTKCVIITSDSPI